MRRLCGEVGFTLIETVAVLSIVGIMVLASWPRVRNATEMRVLDGAARDIMSSLQMARWLAVGSQLNHRVRFVSTGGRWSFGIEVESPPGTWTAKPGMPRKTVPTRFAVALTLPADSAVVFQSSGTISGFDGARSEIALVSANLGALGQENRRSIRFYASGSLRLLKTAGG